MDDNNLVRQMSKSGWEEKIGRPRKNWNQDIGEISKAKRTRYSKNVQSKRKN